jgi:PAS domain-containing protein
MHAMGLRLTALVELGLDLASQRTAADLLELFCRAAQDIMSAHYVGIGILDAEAERLRLWASRGLGDEADAAFASADPLGGLLGKAVATGQSQSMTADRPIGDTGLPPVHPPVCDMVVVPVRSPARNYGWLYLANKLGGEGFGDDDLRIAGTLASQLSLAYENLALCEDLQRHAGRLETETAERMRVETGLRESEERYRQLAENIREVFFVVDPDITEVFYVSPAYEQIAGRSCASLYAAPRSWADAVHP